MADKKYRDKALENKLHHLWCKAIGSKDYDKEEWKDFEKNLLELISNSRHSKKS